MFLKVQGGLKVKIEIDFQRFTQQSMYTIHTDEENVSSILPE